MTASQTSLLAEQRSEEMPEYDIEQLEICMNFNWRVAQDVGSDAAKILHNIEFWVIRNSRNKRHFYDGCFWTYNSIDTYQKQFKWLSESQIRRCLSKLVEKGYVITGEYNKSKYDRTKWYTSTSLKEKHEMTVSSPQDDVNNRSIPDVLPDTNTDTKTLPSENGKSENHRIEQTNKDGTFNGRFTRNVTLQTFLDSCKHHDQEAIPSGCQAYTEAEKLKLSEDLLWLCWLEFKYKYTTLKTNTKQKCWRQTFANAIHDNWMGTWWVDDNTGKLVLSKKGQAQEIQHDFKVKA